MPQMMPLNWNLFFMMFNLIFLIFLMMSFFNYIPHITSKINNLKHDNKSILNFWPLN